MVDSGYPVNSRKPPGSTLKSAHSPTQSGGGHGRLSKKSLYPHFNRNSSDVPGALAVRSVPPTTAIGKTKLDKNGIAKTKDSIAPKPAHA